MQNATEALHQELGALLDTEELLVQAQGQMLSYATDMNLRGALENHQETSQQHVQRVRQVLSRLGFGASDNGCATAQALVDEAEDNVASAQGAAAIDLAIGAAVLKGEAFEVHCYSIAIGLLVALGHDEAAQTLSTNRDEDQEALDMAYNNFPALAQAAE